MFYQKCLNLASVLELVPFSFYPKAENRESWIALPADMQARFIARGEAAQKQRTEKLTLTDWMRYARNGNRSEFEKIYMARRTRLNDMVMAECVEYKGRFLEDIANAIWEICEESAWNLPAHNTYIRDTPALPLPVIDRPIIELFACETGGMLACIRYLLEDNLRQISDILVNRIDAEIDRRIIQPYLKAHFWWMGNGDEPMINWTPWCTQNVLLAALLTPQSEETRRQVIAQAAYSLDCFLLGYGEDGCCNEGAMYYRHAALCLYGATELLCRATNNVFESIWQEEKIRNMAAFIFHMHIDGAYYVNFGDCPAIAGRSGAREFLFAQRTGNAEMMRYAASDFPLHLQEEDKSRLNTFYLLTDAFTAQTIAAYNDKAYTHTDKFYPSAGVFTARDEDYFLAVKAGSNGDSHNHNDTGSFIVYKQNQPMLIDIGVEHYTKKTFSKDRYDIWTMQSSWHNLPDFDGVMQKDGAAFCARDVAVSFGARAAIKMELSSAWPEAAKLQSFQREITLIKGEGIQICDTCTGMYTDSVLHLICAVQPVQKGEKLILPLNGTEGAIVSDGETPVIEAVEITDERLLAIWGKTIYRVNIPFKQRLNLTIS